MEAIELNALIRKETGKGPARRLRMAGGVPAVFYGPSAEAMLLSVNAVDLLKLLRKREENVFIRLIIEDGGKKHEKMSMVKEVQMEPVTRRFYHADFYEISMDRPFTFDVPIHFKGTPAGVENGGELQHVKREIKVSCIPTKLPDFIEVDISGLNIGDHLRVSDVVAMDGLTLLDDGESVIATVSPPKAAATTLEAEAPEEQAEPEVVGQKGAKSES
ncbi:MAG: 50S ribosomal protein L25/general stress protein Ctc [Syntrophales bacterium]|nr:50S ribosomal protein L25/general stress protein Ctc [Syntrophales bacterium]